MLLDGAGWGGLSLLSPPPRGTHLTVVIDKPYSGVALR